jgi:tRNA G18 (ribose-2'-O)-methylase SpoU
VGPITITDPADPRVADFVDLTDAQLRRADGFIVEGELAIRALLRSSYPVRSLFLTPAMYERLAGIAGDAPVYVADLDVMRGVTGFNIHRGAVASAARTPAPDAATLLDQARAVAVLEGLNDHENLGVMFRNAAAFGIDAVLLDPTCADPLYRRTVRVSLGHVLQVPFARVSPWPGALDMVRAAGFELVALTPRRGAEEIGAFSGRTALLFGAEGPGLSGPAMARADRLVRIPIRAGVDSLNVATAAAIAFHYVRPTIPE